MKEICLYLLKKLFCFKLIKFLVFALDKLLVLFTPVIFLFFALPWRLKVGWLTIVDGEIDEIKCAFKVDLSLKE